jgi:methylase of polypeptide subunit release factors
VEDAAERLGTALRKVGYDEDALEALGEDGASADPEDVPVLLRRLEPGPLATVIEALFLSRPVSKPAAVQALGARGVAALHSSGLADVGKQVVPRARVLPVGELLIAGDGFSKGQDDPPDFVTPFSVTSQLCAALTPRHRVRSALDVGTGSGVQALHAARHAGRVIATDVNERALQFTRVNAGLNGLTNIETRQGVLFEPVGDERFDLITCNAPYVISPESRWLYRDGGHTGDSLSARVVEGAAERLADGGFATLNVSWLASDERAPDERVLEWIDTSTCDAWVLVAWEADPLDHAAGWAGDAAHGADVDAALDEWTRYFDGLGARWVTEGTVVLHRRAGRRRTVRIDSIDPDELDDASAQVQRAFAARARLSELPRRDELLKLRLRVATKLTSEQELGRRGSRLPVTLSLADGTKSAVDTTAAAVDVVQALDGALTLEAAIRSTARKLGLDDADASKLRREALGLCRDLLELGGLAFAR